MHVCKMATMNNPELIMEAQGGDYLPQTVIIIHNGRAINYFVEEIKLGRKE